jgi:hypothetical protein
MRLRRTLRATSHATALREAAPEDRDAILALMGAVIGNALAAEHQTDVLANVTANLAFCAQCRGLLRHARLRAS